MPKIIAGIRRGSFLHIPGIGFVSNHPRALTKAHLESAVAMGMALEDDYHKPDVAPEPLYASPLDSSPKTHTAVAVAVPVAVPVPVSSSSK